MGLILGGLAALDGIFNQGRATKAVGDFMGFNPVETPAAQPVDQTLSNESRAQMQALLAQLQTQYGGMANGTGPSLAQGQLQQATDQNISQAMALGQAQQGQGLGYSSALRGIADQSAAARQQAAAQSAMIRNAEMLQGTQGLAGLAGLYGGMRGQDLGQAGMETQNKQVYDQMKYGADNQAAANRRGVAGGVLNAAGTLGGFALGGPPGAAVGGALTSGFSGGGRVPGRVQPGAPMDSTGNDTTLGMLSPEEIVLPRSITLAPDAPEKAKAFVQAIIARRGRGSAPSEEHPALREMSRRKAA